MEATFEIPESQYGCIFYEKGGDIEYKQIPVPKPKSNEILVKVLYSGVCHSDLHAWKGDWPSPTKLPLVGGHEGAGIVVAKGQNVTSFKVGDYAGIKWINSSCMNCEFCEQGAETACPNLDISGYTRDGTFQQYATADAQQAAHISKDVDLAGVAPVLCAGITAYKALKTANLNAGQWVAISGAGGGLGTMAIQYAKAMGLRVLAIDCGNDKEKLCKSLGAEIFVDFEKSVDIVKDIVKATDGGPHGVINVSVSEKAVSQSCKYVRIMGKVILVGLPANAQLITPIFDAVVKAIEIKGTSVGTRKDTAEALEFYNRGLITVPIKILGLSELSTVFKSMSEGSIAGRIVLDTSK